jgi:cyclic pyranopterin phosphate synthase
MKDSFGRTVDYLRLSVTARCNMNCGYCKSSEGGAEMSSGEIARIVKLFTLCGINKIRLTGGEPLVREDICEIVKICKAFVDDVVLTTNGVLLPEIASELKSAGLNRVNISVDSLSGGVPPGVDAAIEAGLTPVKINAVLMRGVNDNEIESFAELAESRSIQVRFIEYMPMGVKKNLYTPVPSVKYSDKISFITPVSHPFCDRCNRVRVTPDCKIRLCLGNNLEMDLREVLRQGDNGAIEAIQAFIKQKPLRGFCEGFITNRGMGNIGG